MFSVRFAAFVTKKKKKAGRIRLEVFEHDIYGDYKEMAVPSE